MRRLLLSLLLLAGAEGAALACSCVPPPEDATRRQQLAKAVATDAVAAVEVELVAPFDPAGRRGEVLRVRRTLGGRAPATFEVERGRKPSSAMCDVEFRGGGTKLVLLYPARGKSASGRPRYQVSPVCTTYLMRDAGVREALLREMRGR